MIVRLLAHMILATAFFQMFPRDAGVLEQWATLPESSMRETVGVPQAFSLLYGSLPAAASMDRVPHKVDATSVGVVTSAVSAVIVDRATGQTLFEKNADEPRSIGSITKLMTAYVFLETNPNLDAPAQIEPQDVQPGGMQHVQVGDVVTVRDLLRASLVGSDNSATQSLVRLSGMPEGDFIARMNETAAELGMQSTTFMDPTGLSPDNRSVAPDVAHMLDQVLRNDIIRETTEQSLVTFTGASGRLYQVETTDELLDTFLNRDPYKVVGGKTGFLPEAGYCLGTVVSENGGHEIMVVVLGSETKEGRFKDVKALAAWAYKVFAWPDEVPPAQS
jgi:D-alanyl-D-alanine carboxypeptidase